MIGPFESCWSTMTKTTYVLTRDLLADIQDSRFELDWVSDVDQALEEMCSQKYDLFLIDYNLGRTDGLTLLRTAIDRGCTAPIIVLTGHGKRAIDLGAMQAGAADFLEKSGLDAAHLERSIRYTLRQKQHSDELERRVHERTAELARANETLAGRDRRTAFAWRRPCAKPVAGRISSCPLWLTNFATLWFPSAMHWRS